MVSKLVSQIHCYCIACPRDLIPRICDIMSFLIYALFLRLSQIMLMWHSNEHSCVCVCVCVYIYYTLMDVNVWVSVSVRGWVAKEGILYPASLKRHRSVQETFLCLLWHKDHTELCPQKCARLEEKDEESQLEVRPRSNQSGVEKQLVLSGESGLRLQSG